MEQKPVLNSLISTGKYEEFIEEIFKLVKYKIPSYVCFANVHMVMEGYRDKAFQKILNNASIVTPDGKPLSLFINYFNKLKQDRVCGMDLFPDLLRQANSLGKSVYLYGDTDEVLARIIHRAKKEFPALHICGHYSPPSKILSSDENSAIIENIKSATPDLVFVALGCPKQEKWMAENVNKIGACLLGVGQAFKIYAGVEKRLPKWMHNLSLEWMYRLYLEPGRLWRRYLLTNSYFIILTLNYMFNRVTHRLTSIFSKQKLSKNHITRIF